MIVEQRKQAAGMMAGAAAESSVIFYILNPSSFLFLIYSWTPPLPPTIFQSTPNMFLLWKEQVSYGSKENMTYQVEVRLSTPSYIKAAHSDPV